MSGFEALVTCPVGLEDLVRGDLLQDNNIRSKTIAPGELLVEPTDLVALAACPAVDRIALPFNQIRALDLPEVITHPVRFRVQADAVVQRSQFIEQAQALGWRNEPSDWQVNIDLQRSRLELGPLSWAGRFGQLRRLPASTPVTVAACALRLAKVPVGATVLDPCGGVGTVAIVDSLMRTEGVAITSDSSAEASALAEANAERFGCSDRTRVLTGDAASLPLEGLSVDRVVSDLPFGKKIGSNADNKQLYPRVLCEIERVLAGDGRAVLLTDDKRLFTESLARTRGLKIVKEHVVRYNGVTPSVYVVTRSRKPKQPR